MKHRKLTVSQQTHIINIFTAIFDAIDVDGNDDISKNEFIAAVESNNKDIQNFILESPWLYKLTKQKKLDEAFLTLDRDNGGHICFNEFWAFCHTHIINPNQEDLTLMKDGDELNNMTKGKGIDVDTNRKSENHSASQSPPLKVRTDQSLRKNKGPRAMILSERNVTDTTYVVTFGDGDMKLLFNMYVNRHTADRTVYLSGIDRSHSSDHLNVGDILLKIGAHSVEGYEIIDVENDLDTANRPLKLLFQKGNPDTEAAAEKRVLQRIEEKRKQQREEQSRLQERLKKKKKKDLERLKKIETAKQRIPKLFDKFDKYGHDHLDIDDFKRMVKKLKVYKPDDELPEDVEMPKVIRMMGDMDNSKTIDRQEFDDFVKRHLDMTTAEHEAIASESPFMKRLDNFLKSIALWLEEAPIPLSKSDMQKEEVKNKLKEEKKQRKAEKKKIKEEKKLEKERKAAVKKAKEKKKK